MFLDKELIKVVVDVNFFIYGYLLLFVVCNQEYYSVVKELILVGVDVNE